MNQTTMDFEQQEGEKVEVKGVEVQYCTVKFTTGWLPGSIGFTDAAKSVLASQRGLDKKIVRGSYAILGASRDPLIKEGAALKRVMSVIRNTYTIPEYSLRSTAAGEGEKPAKVTGSHLIESAKIEEFLERFEEARKQYLAWGKRVSTEENYNRIREADRAFLGDDWAIIEAKYPSAASLADAISCDTPKIEPFDASFTLADVAPETAKMLREQAEARLEASVEGATSELILDFKEMVEAVAKNCGKRIRLLPAIVDDPEKNAKNLPYRHAEVQQILRSHESDDVPENHVLVTIQKATSKDETNTKFQNVGKSEDILMTETEYKAMNHYETDEHRQLAQSSFDNLLWLAKKISTVQTMLGASGESDGLLNLAKEVEGTLGNLGGSAAQITKELKGSGYARKMAKQTFNDLFTRIRDEEIEVKKRSSTRRKIRRKPANG
tara:strand:+ start:6882 stop:8195 length:1314 start_codon:yes stop_codon:yes gene_type:complete